MTIVTLEINNSYVSVLGTDKHKMIFTSEYIYLRQTHTMLEVATIICWVDLIVMKYVTSV